jgi:hypothetical protein
LENQDIAIFEKLKSRLGETDFPLELIKTAVQEYVKRLTYANSPAQKIPFMPLIQAETVQVLKYIGKVSL